MPKFHTLKVADIRRETEQTISIAFEVPEEIKNEYEYIQGQYLTLKIKIKGVELRRSYSICSSPYDDELRIAVKKIKDGRASRYINDNIKLGSEMEVMTPLGNFYTQLEKGRNTHFVGFAAGSGITPIISILKTVLHGTPKSTFSLFYGNRDSDSIIFKEELNRLKEKHGDRLYIYHVLSREETGDELTSGRIDGERAEKLIDKSGRSNPDAHYFICGPEGMMSSVSSMLKEKGVDKNHIHIELFSSVPPHETADQKNDKEGDDADANLVSKVTIILDGEETVIEVPRNGPVIVDAAIDAGLDAPYSCHGGVCMTCRARVVKGKVSMEQNFALSDEEVEEGFALTCQAHPLTDEVIIDYDDIF